MHAQKSHVAGSDEAMRDTIQRQQHLTSLVQQTEAEIDRIPVTVTVTTHHHRSRWFGIFRKNWTSVSQVKNPDKKAQADYFSGIINARNARLKEALKDGADAVEFKKKQEQELAEYEAKYKEATHSFSEFNGRVANSLEEIDKSIAVELRKIEDIRTKADQTENLIGMKGSVLISCLSAIREFAQAEHKHACLYQPLVSILEYVKALTETSLMMLDGDGVDAFAGGIRLVKNVGFFLNTSSLLRTLTTASPERKLLIEQAGQIKAC